VLWWFQWLQLGFVALVLVLVMERMRALYWRDAISDQLFKELSRGAGRDVLAQKFARVRSASPWAPVFSDHDDTREALADVRENAVAQLRLLRVCATMASTLGLLGGILLLAGASLPGEGLLALQAGAVARARMEGAITTMAIGVGSSAFCFQALTLLRRAATRQLTQADQLARIRLL
jgi:hypothetical protein